jgi:phosphate starvation-inducible PhoH-like protein
MFLTRIGFGSKTVVTGDITQIDLPPGKTSGLVESIDVISGINGIVFAYFDETDVIRHRLVQSIIRAYERHSNGKAHPGAAAGESDRKGTSS